MTDRDQDIVAEILRSAPPPDVPADFLSRVNARIDATADKAVGWFGLADFRAWTLRLAPAAAALALVGVFWSESSSATRSSPGEGVALPAAVSAAFSPASSTDWQKDVTGDALVEAALTPPEAGRGR